MGAPEKLPALNPAHVKPSNASEPNLKKGFNNNNNMEGQLVSAAKNKECDKVKELVNGGAHVDAVNEDGDTALMFAARYGPSEVVEWLMNKGASVNLQKKV